jgi:hypothetical protein
MSYALPHYVASQAFPAAPLRYVWDDTRASEDFRYGPPPVLDRLQDVSLRGQAGLAVALYEWILGRFDGYIDSPEPFQVAEALWCAVADHRYALYWEYPREEWMGPVRGPLWCGMTWLFPAVLSVDDAAAQCHDGLVYLTRLALHVLPRREAFERWLQACVDRLSTHHRATPDDPFDDLFNRRFEQRRGLPVARETFDLDRAYDTLEASAFMSRFLAQAQASGNPLLQPAATWRMPASP